MQITIQQAFDLAMEHHRAGRVREADGLYRQIIALQPAHALSIHALGLLAFQAGRCDEAASLIRSAIALDPDFAEAYSNLGNVLTRKGQLEDAIAAHRQAIALSPRLPDAHYNLGLALKDKGDLDGAIRAWEAAILLRPGYADAYYNLGNVLMEKRHLEDAVGAYRRAAGLRPDFPEAHNNLGNALARLGRIGESITAYRRALALNSKLPRTHNNLASALLRAGEAREAIAMYQNAVVLDPSYAEAHYNLGWALRADGQFDGAMAAYRQAIALRPKYVEALNNLGNVLKDQGRLDEAIAAYKQAIASDPDAPQPGGSLLYAIHYHPAYDAETIAQFHRDWARRHAEPLRKALQPHSNNRNPERRLRIGYVSRDFRNHPVGRSLLPLLLYHDRRAFEITCYAQIRSPDEMTGRFRNSADCWNDINDLSDEEVAHQIREDQMDILVDLALHTADNRLLVFARKPAPVQVSYLAYCGSTGLSTMDYRFSDTYMDPPDTLTHVDGKPPESNLFHYSEKTYRLPGSYWNYQPADDTPEVSEPPVLRNGVITFGCLNNFAKISSPVLDLWARVLAAVPGASLILYAPPGEHLRSVAERITGNDTLAGRLRFIAGQSWVGYMKTYGQIDIGLDPFPYGGGMTTCDALWMGVPVVTLSGKTAVGRGGRSILSNIGLPQLVAFSPEQYVQIAVDLARNRDRIAELRGGMRARMRASPLMDAPQFAHDVEAAYRQMWRTWCERM